ncbi:hypothetical protein Q7C36_008419 [Tachysurus vachellii]|uniref:C2H2-type domain-containing protein n=1 Tax=Tachysurus vachellii TaxID=175792 RepID=A0AA88N986_TACVA|nr:zinc finger protein 804A isoform X1 [Tachysurus vachellii]KAK2849636.1 hypothetical protein Q7C36_008419 [Tachysurus vachellii]
MACYYIVISSTHLSNGHFRNIKGVFRGPLCRNGNLDYAEKEKSLAKALEDLKANFYCQLCDKQYYKHQEFDNHINSYDHAHKQRLKELKQREFARNVASKLRKDEQKQERALQRLHKLAEQRREVKCAPGSGPMFKSTTVAVESFNKSCFMDKEENQDIAEQETESQIPWPYRGKAKKQTLRRKIAFSLSFPKRASLKLESSAAVFSESIEEKKMIKYDTEMMTHQKSSTKSSLNDAMPASDLCAFLVYSENRSVSPISHFSAVPGSSNISLDSVESNITESKENSSQEESTISDRSQPTSCDINLFQRQEKDNVVLRRPSQPFLSVVARDSRTIFQWPSEMVYFTKTEPSISFSCNPLYFDFKCSGQYRKSPEVFYNKNGQELSFISEKSHKMSSSCEITTEDVTCRLEKNIRKCHLYSSDAQGKYKHLKNSAQGSKRAEEKLQGRDRRHYRSQHKKRHKRRSRWEAEDYSEPEQSASMKKWTKLHKREGFESQFRGCAAQQERPLEKSKQSAQNQAENNSIVSSAGGSVEAEKVLDISGGTVDVLALGQTTNTQNDSHKLSVIPSDHETTVSDHSSPTLPKKRQSESQSKEDNVWSDHTQCGVIEDLDRKEDVLWLNQRQKRQKLDQSPISENPLFVLNRSDGMVDMESTWNIISLKDPGTCAPEGDNAENKTSIDKNPISNSEIHSQSLPESNLQPKVINHLRTVQDGDSAKEQESENECMKCAITSQVKEKEKVSHDKSCQHTPPLPGFHILDEERHNCAIQSPFNPMLCFTSQLSGVEKHGLLSSHTHKQVLHKKVFSAKLRSTLPISSPILHPIHIPSAIPSGSVTIFHHHSTFIPNQPSLFTQIVPVTRLPLAPEITPFIPSSQVSLVAPPTIHTTAVTFHSLPRPQVFRPLLHPPSPFPPLLTPHTTVIPLQPLF